MLIEKEGNGCRPIACDHSIEFLLDLDFLHDVVGHVMLVLRCKKSSLIASVYLLC
jgi:hypothetical protein